MFSPYLEPVQFELEVLLLVQELLQAVREDDVGVVEAAVFFVELVVGVVFEVVGPIGALAIFLHRVVEAAIAEERTQIPID